jgi:hypothetical protein
MYTFTVSLCKVIGIPSPDIKRRGVKLTTHFHQMQSSRMRGDLPPLLHTSSCRGTILRLHLTVLGEYKLRRYCLRNSLHSHATSSLLGPESQHHFVEGFAYLLFRNLYASLNVRAIKSRRMIWAVYIAQMAELRNAYCVSVGKTEGKRPLRRRRRGL